MVEMLEDRLATVRQIYAPKVKGKRTRNDSAAGPSGTMLPPAHPGNTRMAAYRVPSAVSVFSQVPKSMAGRSPRQELLTDAREQLLNAKKNCAKLVQENTILKTRLLKLSTHSGKREQHLQKLLHRGQFEPAESYDTNEALTMVDMGRRLVKSEALIKQQKAVIESMKKERVRARSAASERRHSEQRGQTIREGSEGRENREKKEAKEAKKEALARTQSLDELMTHHERLYGKYKSLKKENKYLKERIARLEAIDKADPELGEWSREDLLKLVKKLETQALKAPIRAAVATLEEQTRVGKLLGELSTISKNLEDSQQENDNLKTEVDTLVRELEQARMVQKDARPFGVPPLDMKSIGGESDSQAEVEAEMPNIEDFAEEDRMDLMSSEIYEQAMVHAARLRIAKQLGLNN